MFEGLRVFGWIPILDLTLFITAMGVLTWGIERYRSRFEKMDLLIGVVLASGILLFIFLPAAFDRLGDFLDLQNRFAMVSLLANLALLALVLFYASVIRDVKGDLSDLTRNLTIKQAPHADGGREQIFVIIPAYNEGKTIQSVVKSLPDVVRGYEIQPVVVSDGSGDDTARNAKYNGTIVMEHPINQGQGGALKTGFEVANQNGASIVVTMDGDGQHPTDELDRLVSPIIDDEADYVMGSRYIGEDQSGNGPIRRAGIQFYTWLINVLTKSDITDCTNGYRAIRGSMLEELTLTEEQFSAPELIIEARKSGMRIKEIPITIEERQAGDTKKPKLGYAAGLMRTILVTWIR